MENKLEKINKISDFGQKLQDNGLSHDNLDIYIDIPDDFLKTIEGIYFNLDLTIEERKAFQEEIESSIMEKHITEINPNFIITLSVCNRLATKKAELHRNEKAIAKAEEEIELNEDKQKRLK